MDKTKELEVLEKIVELLESVDASNHDRILRTLLVWYGVDVR